ncbi:response regulator transcription factor [Brevibacillus choshinensis]|uniref:Response regulator n=1 Tax=Brevibacillus choshinensis TaxID=54911 RepID=A0ABX7FRR0_BRECH|nr:response regulator [Brevibacillus choshinensis]QRG68926.1 response regulator [Brevibacillus choshinensis]
MSNLVPAFQQLLGEMEASQTSCGVILVACKDLANDGVEAIRNAFEKDTPDVTAHYAYDKTKRVLGVLVVGQKLGETHFHALRVKEYLLERQLLSGSMLITSLSGGPRSSGQMQMSRQTLMKMMQDIRGMEGLGEIHIYDPVAEDSVEDQASILLINSDQTVNEFLTIYLQRKGYQVNVASDGVEGMQKFQEVLPDLVITDLNLPVINGYQLIERIKRAEVDCTSKIVILTDKRLEEDVQKSFALGASDYITKPFSPVELEARVKRLIS